MKLDETAAAARTGMAVKTLQNWRSRGVGPPYYKLGGRILYDEAELDAWLAQQRVAPGPLTFESATRLNRRAAHAA
jgi:predicted DNA-binding transcriptional regulator AlpA